MNELGTPLAAGLGALVGVIDVGSNSIRLVVFEDGARSPDYVFNEKTICRLGEGLGATGRLNPEGKKRALAALGRFVSLTEAMGVGALIGVGTAALREAADGPEFRDEIARHTGLELRVAAGKEEARLAAEGVLLGWPQAEGVVADLGGSSLELAEVRGGKVLRGASTPAGHLRLAEADDPARRAALTALASEARLFPQGEDLVLVGGAWRALAKAEMTRTDYPLHVLMGYEIAPEETRRLCEWSGAVDDAKLKKASGASMARLPSIASGAQALCRLLEVLKPKNVIISAFGLREGLIYERMSADRRAEEPLVAAAARMETRSARSPGFGDELFAWLSPVLGDFTEDKLRLAHGACLLHDVNWRAHPDFRADACFTTVARSNLSGVGHRNRMFIGAALIHRYKSPNTPNEILRAIDLISTEDQRQAEALGRAMRLGAMLTGSVRGLLGRSRLEAVDGELVLTLEPSVATLAGERVERRLAALAGALGLGARLVA